MAEGKLDILSSKSSDQSWTPKGGRSKTETKRTDSKNSRSFADRLLICERSDAFRLIPRIQVSNFLLDSLLRMEMEPGKLFIGGISWDTNEDRLREYFQTFGEVVEAVIMKDRNTGRACGFGFVVFADSSVAERVVREKHIIDGRTEYGIKGFPTIKVFVPGKPPVDYQGARDVKPIAEYALQQIKGLLKNRLHGKEFGTKVEVKNLNSFSAISRAIDFEISRQVLLHNEGESNQIVQETRLWDEGAQKTVTMRKKEGLADYRYFPEPDLPEVILGNEYINGIRDSLPELPEMKRRRYEQMSLSMQDVIFLANDINVADFFDATIAKGADVKLAANWIMGDIAAYISGIEFM
ncbi:hypothetical protein LOK49_LG09G00441 [Camellia lanceoleosa]|uniref:Uncharacterized protein n=1 Tax=Camellia lanceoleosa TaxID=1840588 RepID=A0ACC0GNJ5_9ERIC|nr:hypothetical protein LOK49_LG09G00441 [Camellia lanceoleosa]